MVDPDVMQRETYVHDEAMMLNTAPASVKIYKDQTGEC